MPRMIQPESRPAAIACLAVPGNRPCGRRIPPLIAAGFSASLADVNGSGTLPYPTAEGRA